MSVALFDPDTDDVAVLADLHAASFRDPWDASAIAALLAAHGTFAIWSGDGFVLARAVAGESEILTIAVAPAARNRGLGHTLLTTAATRSQELGATTLFLEVSVENAPALALYARLGFARVGLRKAYYFSESGDQDALILRLPLPAKFA